jgi:hypothetical protein
MNAILLEKNKTVIFNHSQIVCDVWEFENGIQFVVIPDLKKKCAYNERVNRIVNNGTEPVIQGLSLQARNSINKYYGWCENE